MAKRNGGGPWTFFFSHVQRESGRAVALIAGDVEKSGRKVWLDVNMSDPSRPAMMEGVENSEHFLLVLSESYFKSEYCCMELRCAKAVGKHIILCHSEGLNVGAALRVRPREFSDIGDEASIQLIITDPEYRAIALKKILKHAGIEATTAASGPGEEGYKAAFAANERAAAQERADTNTKQYDAQVKLMMLGDASVGKTSVLNRFVDDDFKVNIILPTIGIDFKIKTVKVQGSLDPKKHRSEHTSKVKLQIWDTAGQERFRTITQAYYRGAMGIILVYDVTNLKTWKNSREWISQIAANATQTVSKMLVGNKADMEPEMRQVTKKQGEALAEEYGMAFFETSAKTGQNIERVFMDLTQMVFDRLRSEGLKLPDGGLKLTAAPRGKGRGGCC